MTLHPVIISGRLGYILFEPITWSHWNTGNLICSETDIADSSDYGGAIALNCCCSRNYYKQGVYAVERNVNVG